jgi:hypothetical protein
MSLANPCIEGIRLALFGLKYVAEPAREPTAKVLYHQMSLILRIIVYNEHLPFDRGRQLGLSETLQSIRQIGATIVSAKDN